MSADGGSALELLDPEGALLREIAEPGLKRADIALTYALAIRSSEPWDAGVVNDAIIERWSRSGLKWIKTRAWHLVDGKAQP